jgi:hypothetical protein
MTIDEKISKIADWIVNESQDRYEEVEWLLYSIYAPTKSGLSTDIDESYGDVIELMSDEPSPFKRALRSPNVEGEE